jgi:cell pole-organizing protein PopZ
MNKPETKPAQSLEEILASIRKALAEEEVQGEPESPASVEPAPVVGERHPAAAKGDALSGQLAVALNGSGSSEEALADDDLADLLAPIPAKVPTAAPEKAAEKKEVASEPAGGEPKDPLWFLARQPAPKDELPQPAAREEEAPKPARVEETAAPREEEEAALTRLEALRSSLPPLFGSGEGAPAGAEPASIAKPAPAAKPLELRELAAPEKAKDEKPEVKAPPPEKPPVAQATIPAPEPAAPASAPQPGPAMPSEAMASALAEPGRSGLKGAPALAAQARALEEMIGQLLEPVIRNWLETNLPRLVEKVVREEVARTNAAKPDVIDT